MSDFDEIWQRAQSKFQVRFRLWMNWVQSTTLFFFISSGLQFEQCFLFPNPISAKILHHFYTQPCSAQAGYFGKHKTFIQTTRNFKRTLSSLLLVTESPSLGSCTGNYLSLGQAGQERGDLWVNGILLWSGRLGYKAMPLDTAFSSVALQFTTGDFSSLDCTFNYLWLILSAEAAQNLSLNKGNWNNHIFSSFVKHLEPCWWEMLGCD